MNKKFFCSSLSIKSIEENGLFSGYASVFNAVDKQNDLIPLTWGHLRKT